MSPAVNSLRGAVQFGLENGKRSVIAELAPLKELFDAFDALVAAVKDLMSAGTGPEWPEAASRLWDMAVSKAEAALKLAEAP